MRRGAGGRPQDRPGVAHDVADDLARRPDVLDERTRLARVEARELEVSLVPLDGRHDRVPDDVDRVSTAVAFPARPRLTVSASRKTRTSVLLGAPNGVPSQPPFLSRIPGWIPPVISKVWPSGQFLTVWSRCVIDTSGTSIDISGGPISRGAITLVR